MKQSGKVLPVIVFSQFCCTSLWFAGNGVMGDLVRSFHLGPGTLGELTSMVQLGFISGTLLFALLTIADRFSPSRVFLVCAALGALVNLGMVLDGNRLESLLALRFLTGFFLAGIYPVGMKIAADYFDKGLGRSLGYLVGALVLGTAFPHLLKELTQAFPWKVVVAVTSALALLGGLMMVFLVPDGPHRKPAQQPDLSAAVKIFRNRDFRAVAFGYFGHMWELYAFWAFVPVMLKMYVEIHPSTELSLPVNSFLIIAVGGPACVLGALFAQKKGTKRTAALALFLSGLCCIVAPFTFALQEKSLFMSFLLFWGMVVIADSPLFSTLVARNSSPDVKGTALTIVNCIGFAITIGSIQLLDFLYEHFHSEKIFCILAAGPVLGLVALYRNKKPQVQ